MRKSTRETKKPEVFAFPDAIPSKSRSNQSDDEDNMDSSQSVEKTIRQPKAHLMFDSMKKAGNKTEDLFDTIRGNRSIVPEVLRWINLFKSTKVQAMVELVNFLMLAAGAKEERVPSDVDLEALEPEELDVLLVETMREISDSDSKVYPLSEKPKSKGGRTFRDKFKAFWLTWTEKVLAFAPPASSSSSSSSSNKRLDGHEILRTVIDQLVALSSMAVVNIRDSVTEAALSLARGLLQGCAALKAELDTVGRQIAAEESQKSKAAARQNPKYQACVKQQEVASKELEVLSGFSQTIFNSIFVHRVKDFHDEVRITALQHLIDFIRFEPPPPSTSSSSKKAPLPLRVEYLKYLGWACSDFCSQVRMDAITSIQELVEDQALVPYLQGFVEHFIDRFVQIAGGDVDDHVSLAMIEALRVMQRNGLLDNFSEEKLDVVDLIVFDDQACARVRQEALAFLMDHTEGFDDEPEDAEGQLDLSLASITGFESVGGGVSSKKGGKKAVVSKSDQARALARRQRTAQQLETLTEFAEHHLGCRVDWAPRLAEACLGLRKYNMLYNWSTTIALLLRESDELITSALRPIQSSILLRMFVHCAVDLTQRRAKFSTSSGSLSSADRQFRESWESLNENLQMYLPALLTRFKDDEENLIVLVELLSCCEYSEERPLKALLKVLLELFDLTRQERILSGMATCLAGWLRTGGTIAGTVEGAVRRLLQACWQTILDLTAQLQGIVARREGADSGSEVASAKKGAKRKSKTTTSQAEKEEVLLGLHKALLKLKVFWKVVDCQQYFDEDVTVSQMADELATVAEVVPSFCEGELLSGVLTDACIAATSATAYTIRSAVLWNTRELALLGRQLTALQAQAHAQDGGSRAKKVRKGTSNNSSSSQEGTVDEDMENHSSAPSKAEAKLERSISMAVDGVIALREKLLDVLQAWISAEVPPQSDSQSGGASSQSSGSLSSSSARLVRALQIEAFDQVNFLRTVFPVRETQYKYIDRLAFTPTQAMLGGLQKVFEAEGSRVRTELMSCSQGEAQNDAAINRLSHKLISSLFDPLSCNLLNDVEHLNRKQAAAVIYYLLDANQVIEDNIKSFMRNLKERNLVKYLEIQLVALKGLFQSGVTKPTQARIAADEAEDDDFDRAENDALIAEGYHRLETLARKLGHSLGVGKCKDDGLVGLENFFKAAIDYALSDEFNVGFAGCLCHYTRFLPPQSQRDISEHFLSVLDAHPAIANEMVDQRARDTDADFYRNTEGFSRLLDFADAIQGRARPKMTRRKSSTGSYAVNRSAELSRMDDVPARTGAKQAAPKTAPASKQRKNVPQQQMRLAVSSQVLADEDLALIHGGRYDEEQSSARNGKKAKVGPVAKVAAARGMKSATAPMKSAVPPNNSRQSARSSARSVGSKSYAEADSSEGEQEEDDDEEGEEDEEEVGEEGMGAGEEEEESEVEDIDEDDYSGLSGAASKRGYQQPFRHQTQTQTQTQIQRQTQAKAQTKTKAKTQSKAQWAAGTNQRSQASTTFGGIVLGLDIEDVDDADINMDLVGEGDEEEDDIEDVSGASSSRSGLGRSGSGNQQGGNPKKRSLGQSGMGMGMGGGSVAADSFAELDSIPSRRRLRA